MYNGATGSRIILALTDAGTARNVHREYEENNKRERSRRKR